MSKMSSGRVTLFFILGVLIVALLWGMGAYNGLVGLDENAQTAQADIEVQYQRRFDLIPNLLGSVQGIFDQEREVFGQLAEARTRYAGSAAGSSERVGAIQGLDSALGRLLVVMENYPELRSSESVQKLQDQLEGTENRVQVARNNYNAAVNALNKKIRRFPSNIVAGLFNFDARERFEASEEASNTVPEVNFNK